MSHLRAADGTVLCDHPGRHDDPPVAMAREREHIRHRNGHAHTHGLMDRSIVRSRAGIKAVSISLALLSVTAAIQTVIYALTISVALLADLIHDFGDAVTAVPLGLAFFAQRAGRALGGSGGGVGSVSQRVCGADADDLALHPPALALASMVAGGRRRDRVHRQRDRRSDPVVALGARIADQSSGWSSRS